MDAARRAGRYTLGEKIGSGGLADVFEARAEGADGFAKRLVLKRIRSEYVREAQAAQSLRREAMLARELDHGNIVQVFDYGEADAAPYIVMERVDGCSLRRLLEAPGQLHVADALHIVEQIAGALHYLHRFVPESGGRGLIHRDVKPENILVSRRGVVKLTDFGIAKPRCMPTQTEPGFIKGTPRYLAPEQAAGRPLDGRADIYALGTVLTELCEASGHDGPSTTLERATALDPGDRFDTAHELRVALEAWRVREGLEPNPDRLAARVNAALATASAKVVSLDAGLGLDDVPAPAAVRVQEAHPIPATQGGERQERPTPRRSRTPVLVATLSLALGVSARALWPAGTNAPAPTSDAQPAPEPPLNPAPVVPRETRPAPETTPEPTPEPIPAPVVKTGRLSINVLPYADVRIDGKRHGGTPVKATLTAGRHRVRLENPATGKTAQGTVLVRPFGTTTIKTWNALQ